MSPGATEIFIIAYCTIAGAFKELAKEYADKGVKTVSICSSSTVTHPQDGPEPMAQEAKEMGKYMVSSASEQLKSHSSAVRLETWESNASYNDMNIYIHIYWISVQHESVGKEKQPRGRRT